MKFSIIVPIYNVEQYLAECLDSILKQSYTDFEVICINDASTDASYELLLEYAGRDSRIRVINNEVNGGLSYSRNRGLEAAQGDYVFFVDSDDYIAEDALKSIYNVLKHNSVDILNFNFKEILASEYCREKNIVIRQNDKNELTPKSGQQWLIDINDNINTISVTAWNKIFKRSFLIENNLNFYEGIVHEDILFCFQAFIKAKNVVSITDQLYFYRRRDKSISTTYTKLRLDSFVITLSELLFLWKSSNLRPETENVIKTYLTYPMSEIKAMIMYFFDHKELSVGKAEDQFLFSLIRTANQIPENRYINFTEDELEIINRFKKRIVYGAGQVSIDLLRYCKLHDIDISAVAVSNKGANPPQIMNCPVYQIDELAEHKKNTLVIVAVGIKNRDSVKTVLNELGFENILYVDTNRSRK